MKTSNTKSVVPATELKAIAAACGATAKRLIAGHAKATATRNAELSKLADAFRKAGVKIEQLTGNAKSNPIRAVVKDFFDGLSDDIYRDAEGKKVLNPTKAEIEKGKLELVCPRLLTKSSAASYQTCFWIAFEKNVPFSTDLANQKTAAKKESANVGKGQKADAAKKVKGSIVVTASRDNLQSLLMQTIKMARDLSLGDFALELVEAGKDIDLLPKSFK